ncbi:MAG: sigma factor [Erysipelotrichaceae bacterium]
MQNQSLLLQQLQASKTDEQVANQLLEQYRPFILSQVSNFTKAAACVSDDTYSIALHAFYEAILRYVEERGNFISYAALCIRSRLLDDARKQARRQSELSLDEEVGEEGVSLHERIAAPSDSCEVTLATQEEILELTTALARFGISFADLANNTPKQERTKTSCASAIAYAASNTELLDILLQTKKLPLAALVAGSGVERKTLERHRTYLIAMLLIQTNGFVLLRGHLLRSVQKRNEVLS